MTYSARYWSRLDGAKRDENGLKRIAPRVPVPGGRHHPVGTPSSGSLGEDEAAADRVARQLDAVAHAELLEDVLAVALDRLDADHELRGDLLRRVGLGDQLQHLKLARGEHIGLGVLWEAPLDVVANERCDRRGVQERRAAHR